MLSSVLRAAGWEVVEAVTGTAALEWVATQTPALIILDLLLPDQDGIQLLDQLPALPQGSQIPVVVVTARDLTPSERARLRGTVAQILEKGDHPLDALLTTVHNIIVAPLCEQRVAV